MKKINISRPGLLVRILIAIALGIGAGFVLPEWAGRIFATFNAIFSQFLSFIIPLLIVGFVTPAIADIGRKAGKMLVVTALIAYIATVSAGLVTFFAGNAIFPSLISPAAATASLESSGTDLLPYLIIEMPPLMTVMTALVLAFVCGLGIAYLPKGETLKRAASEFRDIITMVISGVIIPLLPIYIFGIFVSMVANGQVAAVLAAFAKIIGIIFVLHICLLILQYCVAAMFVRRNPFKLLITMLPAYFTALGTQSSAATIPVTLRQAMKMGVSEDVAGFTIPLCATIHMSGSTLKIVACALSIMLMQSMPYTPGMFIGFICMLAITIIAAPGVPGGAIMASLGILGSMLGFSAADQALMIALYIAMDSFGTACNVTGDGFIALIVDRYFRPSNQALPTEYTNEHR